MFTRFDEKMLDEVIARRTSHYKRHLLWHNSFWALLFLAVTLIVLYWFFDRPSYDMSPNDQNRVYSSWDGVHLRIYGGEATGTHIFRWHEKRGTEEIELEHPLQVQDTDIVTVPRYEVERLNPGPDDEVGGRYYRLEPTTFDGTK